MAVDKPARELRERLTPYVEKLSIVAAPGESGQAPAVVAGSQRMETNAWEREALARALDGATEDEWEGLLVEAYALEAKYLTEFAENDADGEAFSEPQRNRLTDDATLGLILMEQTQRAVNAMVLSGQIDQAKHLSTFRNRIGHTVTAMKEQLGDQAFCIAEARSVKIVPPVEPGPVHAPIAEPPPVKRAPKSVCEPAPETDGRAEYTRPLLLILAVAIVAWVIVVLPRLSHEPMHVLTIHELPHSTMIAELTARPPSLFVELRSDEWTGLGPDERLRIVEEIGQAARASGYTGAQFTSSEGGTVASWLREAGATLTTRSDSPS